MASVPFLKGFAIGFSIAIPVGPMGVLCIHRTLDRGRWVGFLTGLGIATADALYASVAAFGITVLLRMAAALQGWTQACGGLFLLYLGIRIFLSQPRTGQSEKERQGPLAVFGTTLLLTLSNPPTLFSFMALFATLGEAGQGGGAYSPALLVAGVFTGSAFWWLLLSQGVSLFPLKMGAGLGVWVNRVSGVVIGGFGVFSVFIFLKGWL